MCRAFRFAETGTVHVGKVAQLLFRRERFRHEEKAEDRETPYYLSQYSPGSPSGLAFFSKTLYLPPFFQAGKQ
jgi:hypothetical protein